jgi:hypothetical protein
MATKTLLGSVASLRFLPVDELGRIVSIGVLSVLILLAAVAARRLRRAKAGRGRLQGGLHDHDVEPGAVADPGNPSTRPDERPARKPDFVGGVHVRLSDGSWRSLPLRDPDKSEPEYDGLLVVICEAEDREERLLGELALTVHLLEHNYAFAPGELADLLSFSREDPALAELQNAVGGLVSESVRRLGWTTVPCGEGASARPHEKDLPSPPSRSSPLGKFGIT